MNEPVVPAMKQTARCSGRTFISLGMSDPPSLKAFCCDAASRVGALVVIDDSIRLPTLR